VRRENISMAAIARPRAVGRRRSGELIRNAVLVVGLTIFAIWTLFPLVWIIETSIKPNSEIYAETSLIPREVTLTHYTTLLT
jgi:ABC-type glycerol-3-phosphate transport system permease component